MADTHDTELDQQIRALEDRVHTLKALRAAKAPKRRVPKRLKPTCRHQSPSAFKVGTEWKCSHCGKVGAWRKSWSFLGCIGCKKCQREPGIEAVVCSDECRAFIQSGAGER